MAPGRGPTGPAYGAVRRDAAPAPSWAPPPSSPDPDSTRTALIVGGAVVLVLLLALAVFAVLL
jgi:hypothetical protein